VPVISFFQTIQGGGDIHMVEAYEGLMGIEEIVQMIEDLKASGEKDPKRVTFIELMMRDLPYSHQQEILARVGSFG
jgi:hypothetical protein